MYKREMLRLRNKLIEVKEIYEQRKTEREELILEINKLDNEIESFEKIIKSANNKSNNSKVNKTKIKNNQIIKKLIKECISRSFSQSSIIVLGAMIFSKWLTIQNIILTILFLLVLNTIAYSISYLIIRQKVPKNKKISSKKLEDIEKEYQEVVKKRLSIGQQYKQTRDKEIESYNVYKTTEQLIESRIDYLNKLTPVSYNPNDTIHLNDIYYKIVMEPVHFFEATETKKKILDEQLKNYLIEKIGEINYNISKSNKLSKITTEELVMVLSNYIPKNKHADTLNHIIHAILGYASNMQSHSIIWYEERNEDLIDSPIITYDEQGRWNELKTHRNTDYVKIFNIVYDNFFNNFMVKENEKIRTK